MTFIQPPQQPRPPMSEATRRRRMWITFGIAGLVFVLLVGGSLRRNMGGILALAGLAVIGIAVFALIRGRADWARLRSRNHGVAALVAGIATLFVASVVLPGSADEDDDTAAPPTVEPVRTTTTSSAPPTSTQATPSEPVITSNSATTGPPYPVHAECRPASDEYVSIINAAFTDRTQALLDAFEYDAAGITYVAANIYRGDTRLSSADVWAVGGGAIYALSGDARNRTELPDGRDVLNASAGDGYAVAVTDCVGNAAWERNQTGRAAAPAPLASIPPVIAEPTPEPEPEYTPPPVTRAAPPVVHYANCAAVRAANAAPIHRGEPGYSSDLDRDGDGIACDT